jgi:hypothetical protein
MALVTSCGDDSAGSDADQRETENEKLDGDSKCIHSNTFDNEERHRTIAPTNVVSLLYWGV